MVRVDGRGRVDLQAVIVLPSIFKQTVHRVEHLMGQEEKPLSVREERTEQWDALRSSCCSAGSEWSVSQPIPGLGSKGQPTPEVGAQKNLYVCLSAPWVQLCYNI